MEKTTLYGRKIAQINDEVVVLTNEKGEKMYMEKADILKSLNIKGKGIYTNSTELKGILVTTNIPAGSSTFFLLEIKGNGYASLGPIDMKIQGYAFTGNSIIHAKAFSILNNLPIKVFFLNNRLSFWFSSTGPYQTFYSTCSTSGTTGFYEEDAIMSIQLSSMPDNAVGLVEVTPVVVG